MHTEVSAPFNALIKPVIDRLEKTPVEFIEALIDLLAVPERKRDEHLLQDLLVQVWFLLEFPKGFIHSALPVDPPPFSTRTARPTRYEQLIELMCGVIETEIVRHLPFNQETQSFVGSRTAQLFWGGLTLHIKLALPLEPQRGSTMFSNDVVTLTDGKLFPCELPLSESKIYQLFTQLEHSFISQYVASYVRNERLRDFVARFSQDTNKNASSKNGSTPLELIVQERTLNRYVDKFAKRIATHFFDAFNRLSNDYTDPSFTFVSLSSANSMFSQITAVAASALVIEPKHLESLNVTPNPIPIVAHTQSQLIPTKVPIELEASEGQEFLEHFNHLQRQEIRDSIHTDYIAPILVLDNLNSQENYIISLDALIDLKKYQCLVVAPPGGGKTRLLKEILLRAGDEMMCHLYLDVSADSFAGFRSLYHFTANYILNWMRQEHVAHSKIESELESLELNGKIIWYFDGWDEVSEADLPTVTQSILRLNHFFLAASNPYLIIERMQRIGAASSKIISIQPFTQEQIAQFIEKKCCDDESMKVRLGRRVLQAPGLAKLPNGLVYLCTNGLQKSLMDTLFGYLNDTLKRTGQPCVQPNDLANRDIQEIKGQPGTLSAVLCLANAIYHRARTSTENLSQIATAEILPYMGASNHTDNIRLARTKIETAIRGKFLQADENSETFRFIVPEIGYLLIALAAGTMHHGSHRGYHAPCEFQENSHDAIYEIMLALEFWRREKLLFGYGSALQHEGTMVPNM